MKKYLLLSTLLVCNAAIAASNTISAYPTVVPVTGDLLLLQRGGNYYSVDASNLASQVSINFGTNTQSLSVNLPLNSRHAHQALYNRTLWKVGDIGDSVGYRMAFGMTPYVDKQFGYNGANLIGQGFGTIVVPGIGGNTVMMPNADTNWFAPYFIITNGCFVYYTNVAPGTLADSISVSYIKNPLGGNFLIDVSTNGGVNWDNLKLVNGNGTRLGVMTNFTTSLKRYNVRIAGVSGTNIIIGGGLWNSATNGVRFTAIYNGGINIGHMTNVDLTTVLQPILTNLNLDTLFFEMKDCTDISTNSFADIWPSMENILTNCFPNTDIILSGTTPQRDNDDLLLWQDLFMRERAIQTKMGFFDGRAIQTYDSLTNMGWVDDVGTAVHVNDKGYAQRVGQWLTESGLAGDPSWPIARVSDQFNNTMTNNIGFGTSNPRYRLSVQGRSGAPQSQMGINEVLSGYMGIYSGAAIPADTNYNLMSEGNSTVLNAPGNNGTIEFRKQNTIMGRMSTVGGFNFSWPTYNVDMAAGVVNAHLFLQDGVPIGGSSSVFNDDSITNTIGYGTATHPYKFTVQGDAGAQNKIGFSQVTSGYMGMYMGGVSPYLTNYFFASQGSDMLLNSPSLSGDIWFLNTHNAKARMRPSGGWDFSYITYAGDPGAGSVSADSFKINGKPLVDSTVKLTIASGTVTNDFNVLGNLSAATFNANDLVVTNGWILTARDTIPTNSIPASNAAYTNYVLINWTNMGPVFVATNYLAAGKFIVARPTLTITSWP